MKNKLILLFLAALLVPFPNMSGNTFAGVTDIHISPVPIQEMSNVTLSVTVSDPSVISSVRLTYCRLTPEYLCYFPSYRLQNSSTSPNVYLVVIQIKEEDINGTEIGFHFLVSLTNGTSVDFPSSNQPSFGMSVSEPVPDTFYYSFKVGAGVSAVESSQTPTNTNSSNLPLLFGYVFLVPIVLYRKKTFSGQLQP